MKVGIGVGEKAEKEGIGKEDRERSNRAACDGLAWARTNDVCLSCSFFQSLLSSTLRDCIQEITWLVDAQRQVVIRGSARQAEDGPSGSQGNI